MAESIVKVPSAEAQGLDFLAFSFNGKHSWDDFHIYRVINGDRYEENLSPTLTDKTAEVPGGDGMYYFGTTHKQKEFNISFAFDHLTEIQLREMKKWLNGKEMGDLWFSEAPYKVWSAKPTGNSSIKYIPFDELDEQGNTVRIYKGEGSVQFTAYWPYAHTPDYVGQRANNGKDFDSYRDFINREEWGATSGLTASTGQCMGENPGDLPTPFIYTHPVALGDSTSQTNTYYKIKIGNVSVSGSTESFAGAEIIIEVPKGKVYNNLSWDSKTGLVSAKVGSSEKPTPILVTGHTCYAIPVGGVRTIQFFKVNGENDNTATNESYKVTISYNNGKETGRVWQQYTGTYWQNVSGNSSPSLNYHYWYY